MGSHEDKVLELNIAVHNVVCMEVGQRPDHLADQRFDPLFRKPRIGLLGKVLNKVAPGAELHHFVEPFELCVHRHDLDDIWMVEVGQDLHLAL